MKRNTIEIETTTITIFLSVFIVLPLMINYQLL